MLEQSRNCGAHVLALEQWRCYLVPDFVCGPYTTIKIGAHDPLASGIGKRRAARKALGERSSYRLKDIVRNDSVYDVPPLKRCGIILLGCVDNFPSATRPGSFRQALNA